MIGYLRGRVFERGEDVLVLDVAGVGYELQCSSNTLDAVFGRDEVELHVQTHVREDAITLFGFSSKMEKEMFLSLIKVQGIGPKMAIKILSGATLAQLGQMIEAGDVKALSNLPKVGKKTAEQLILTLKGKLVLADEQPSMPKRAAAQAAPRFSGVRADVQSALVNLGFKPQDVEKVVTELDEDIDLQQGIRRGLQVLSGH